MAKQEKTKRKHEDTRISAYPHSLEEVLEKALQVPPPKDGFKREDADTGPTRHDIDKKQ